MGEIQSKEDSVLEIPGCYFPIKVPPGLETPSVLTPNSLSTQVIYLVFELHTKLKDQKASSLRAVFLQSDSFPPELHQQGILWVNFFQYG